MLPVKKTVEFIRRMKAAGHTIVLHSQSSGTKAVGGAGSQPSLADQLAAADIPYDELLYNKVRVVLLVCLGAAWGREGRPTANNRHRPPLLPPAAAG